MSWGHDRLRRGAMGRPDRTQRLVKRLGRALWILLAIVLLWIRLA
jgi:hypothetical protein